jgi:FecR protein
MKKRELDNILDQITAGIRSEQIDNSAAKEASDRVWSRVSQVSQVLGDGVQDAGASVRIEGCADFQSLIPAYISGNLSEARSLLLVDHTHECIPCRKALKQARESRSVARVAAKPKRKSLNYSLQPVVLRWGIAAVLLISLGLVALPLIQRYLPFGSFEATVQAADGPVYAIANSQIRSLSTGEKIGSGDAIRTAKDAHAIVRLADGSTIEMNDRAEFSITQSGLGSTIHLDRGSVIVQAAKQKGHLFVDTDGGNSLVSVTGTTFAVNTGTKGSRVSVIEGEVHLDHNGQEQVLRAGQQATTNASIEAVPVKNDVAWSRNSARYVQALDALASLNKELNAVPKPGVRHSTHLLDMMPENTVVYAALPNLSATIAESHRIMQERIQQNPALHDWFDKGQRGPGMDQAISAMREFGEQLGDEIAVGAGIDEKGNPVGPIVLAELKNASGFRAFFDDEIKKLGTQGKNGPSISFVDDPNVVAAPAQTTNSEKEIFVWIHDDVLAASPKLDQLQALAKRTQSANSFATTPFYARVAEVYRDGAGLLVAADLEKIIAQTKTTRSQGPNSEKHEQVMSQLGIFNLKYFVFDQKDVDGRTDTRAVLSFNETNHGVTSWLAKPAPMGSLEYISPDANVVAGFVVKNPVALVDDLLGALDTVCPDLKNHLTQLQTDHGLDVRKDFAAPLGGEYAFAIDGPILPMPSWKLIFEVNDPTHLQQTLEHVTDEINKQAAKENKKGLTLDRSDDGGRTFYTLKSQDFGLEVNYTFANGYMIVGPTRALVAQAIRYHDSGTTLLRSSRFTAGLPADGNANFSAIVYYNIGSLVKPLAGFANSANGLGAEQQKAIAIAANMQPTLFYAYAFGDHIEFASNSEAGPFGISPAMLLGMPNAFELGHILGGIHGGNRRAAGAEKTPKE